MACLRAAAPCATPRGNVAIHAARRRRPTPRIARSCRASAGAEGISPNTSPSTNSSDGHRRRALGVVSAAPTAEVAATSADAGGDDPTAAALAPRGSPSTTTFTPPPKGSGVVSWTRHMAWLHGTLEAALGPLTPVLITEDLATMSKPGKARAETWVYSCAGVRRVRFTYVDAGANAQIFNAVVYPRCDSEHGGDTPLLGVDLLCLAGGKKCLVGVDLQPLSRDAAYLERYAPALAAAREMRFADLNLVVPSKKFYEDAKYFSPAMLFARPKPSDMAAAAGAAAAAEAGIDYRLMRDSIDEDPDAGVSLLENRVMEAGAYTRSR